MICGWTKTSACIVLAYEVIHGAIDDDLTWRQLDDLLRQRWQHPLGGQLKIDACAIDGGDGAHLAHVLAFCRARAARRVMCIKGAPGFTRPPLLASKSKMKGGGRLWICGSDTLKSRLFDQLQRGTALLTRTSVFKSETECDSCVMDFRLPRTPALGAAFQRTGRNKWPHMALTLRRV